MADAGYKESAKGYTVSGYHFKTKETATEAKNELNAIKYVSAKTDTKDPRQVYLLYNKLLDRELFKTLVGINYLRELQQFLYLSDEVPNDKIRPIPIHYELQEILDTRREVTNHKSVIMRVERERDRYKNFFVKSVIVNVALIVVIIAIAILFLTSSNPTILNYETKLQDRYAGWQEQIESQEASLKAWEKELNHR